MGDNQTQNKMKSVTMNQTALKTEIFFAYMRNREFEDSGFKGFVRGSAMSHEFEMSFEIWQDGALPNVGNYRSISKHNFSKSEAPLNSVEPSDIVEYIHQQFHIGLGKFRNEVMALPENWDKKGQKKAHVS